MALLAGEASRPPSSASSADAATMAGGDSSVPELAAVETLITLVEHTQACEQTTVAAAFHTLLQALGEAQGEAHRREAARGKSRR